MNPLDFQQQSQNLVNEEVLEEGVGNEQLFDQEDLENEPVVQAAQDIQENANGDAKVVEEAPQVERETYSPVKTINPTYHQLSYVGYDIDAESKNLQVSILTNGNPQFEIFQEQNQSVQPELVIRLFQTSLRRKIKWDIDASEFRSPVAYIRMRESKNAGTVDVILTMRDAVEGSFYSKNSNISLSFPIPDYYFGNLAISPEEGLKKAELLGKTEISLLLSQGSEQPVNLGKQEGQDLNPEEGEPIEEVLDQEDQIDSNGLPGNFGENLHDFFPSEYFLVSQSSAMAVGQDNGNDNNDFVNDQGNLENLENNENFNNQGSNENLENNQAISQGNFNNTQGQEDLGNNLEGNVNLGNNEEPVNIQDNSNLQFENNAGLDENPLNSNALEQQASEVSEGDNQFNEGLNNNLDASQENSELEIVNEGILNEDVSNEDFIVDDIEDSNTVVDDEPVANQESTSDPMKEQLLHLEFTDAPLSLVFKSFAEETGKNFVFPNDVAALTISIHFKGVPWDEALKAILETHSLGMVRVGKYIVRIDRVDKLTAYLRTLEQAQQYETRRSPTKILVFRLNNAKAPDVVERINALITRDKSIDPRIQVSADLRTNSIVMEAPDLILAKAKNVVERLDLETPQVEIVSRIVEVQKTNSDLFGISWLNQAFLNYDPGRGLGFGSLNFPNSLTSSFSVDPGVRASPAVGNAQFKFGSINRFMDLDLLLRMEERRGTTNVLQSNRVLVVDGEEASISAGSSKFFRAAGAAAVGDDAGDADGLSEVKFNLSLNVKPQVTANGAVIMDLLIQSDTPGAPTGEVLADKNTRELKTRMVRDSGDTGVIGGIYDTSKTETVVGIPFLSSLPIVGALFRSTITEESQTELLIMVTPTIASSKRDGDSGRTARTEDENGNNINF